MIHLRILKNSVRCKKCKQEIESKSEFGRVTCKCGTITIGGGKKVLARYAKEGGFVETSLIENSFRKKVK